MREWAREGFEPDIPDDLAPLLPPPKKQRTAGRPMKAGRPVGRPRKVQPPPAQALGETVVGITQHDAVSQRQRKTPPHDM